LLAQLAHKAQRALMVGRLVLRVYRVRAVRKARRALRANRVQQALLGRLVLRAW
jgi:hypothetical protein